MIFPDDAKEKSSIYFNLMNEVFNDGSKTTSKLWALLGLWEKNTSTPKEWGRKRQNRPPFGDGCHGFIPGHSGPIRGRFEGHSIKTTLPFSKREEEIEY